MENGFSCLMCWWLVPLVLACVVMLRSKWVWPKLVYFLKFAFLYASLMLCGVVIIPYGLWHFDQPWKVAKFSSRVMKPVSWVLGIRWTVHGHELIKQDKAYVVVCNHQSSLDVLAALQVWNYFFKAAMVAKRELKFAGPFGLVLVLTGTIFIDRAASAAGRESINKAGQKAKQSSTSLWVFPEGTRHRGSTMLPFKKGAFHVALDAGIPILPVVVHDYHFVDDINTTFSSGHAHIQILPPIEPGCSKDSINELVQETWNRMNQAQIEYRHSGGPWAKEHAE